MIPILYGSSERNFISNGLGRLADAVECTVTEERNGVYELFMRYPTSGNHYADIALERLIYAAHDDTKTPQPFRIYKISKPLNGIVSIYAEHISYLLNKVIVEPFSASSCTQALTAFEQKAIGGTEFSFWTDKTVTGDFKVEAPQSIRALLAGQSGSILDVYGTGEYEWDGFEVKLHLHRGANNGVTLRYGKNITDITADTDMSNTYTAIVPFWKGTDDQMVMLPEKILYAGTQYTDTLAKAIDFSSEWEEAPTEEQLRTRAQAYLTSNKGWEIKQNVKVDFVQLWQTEEYANYAPLQRVRLCDTVNVIYEPLNVETTAEVVKTVYNVLLERYDEVEVGEAPTNLSGAVADVVGNATADLPDQSMMEKAITHATNLIKGGLGGYVVIKTNADGQPEEILIMDTPDINTAVHVLRINKNGIGFSSNGYDGTYRSAWTLDGHFVADFITAGTMQANRVRAGLLTDEKGLNYWNLDTGEFKLSQAAAQDIAKNGMSQETVFNALTNNGAAVGVYLQNGQLYINASYIKTGQLSANMVRTGLLTDEKGLNYWNLDTGEFKLSQAASEAIARSGMSQQEVFNALTNNGAALGIFLQNGELYINASYINAGYLSADRIKAGTITAINGVSKFNLDDGDLYIGYSQAPRAHIRALNGAYILEHYNGGGWVETGSFYNDLQRGLSMLYSREIYLDKNGGSAVRNEICSNGDDDLVIHGDNKIKLEGDIYINNSRGITGTYWVTNSQGNAASFQFNNGILIGTTGF